MSSLMRKAVSLFTKSPSSSAVSSSTANTNTYRNSSSGDRRPIIEDSTYIDSDGSTSRLTAGVSSTDQTAAYSQLKNVHQMFSAAGPTTYEQQRTKRQR